MNEEHGKVSTFGARLFVAFQKILPTHLLSTLMFRIAQIRHAGFKNWAIRTFLKHYAVDLKEAEYELPDSYEDFNTFFTRALKRDARPVDADPRALVSPADGRVSQVGRINEEALIQAKGIEYPLSTLLGGHQEIARAFHNGGFCTIYLAPHNYHRLHMPATGTLRRWIYVPGKLFSVNAATTRTLPGLFGMNERVCAIFETDRGPLAVIMVGALFVGSIETVWAGRVTPPHGGKAGVYTPMQPVTIGRGMEMGRFNMGSTVILLAAADMLDWHDGIEPEAEVRVGQRIGLWRR